MVFEGPAHLAGKLVPVTIEDGTTQTLYGRVADRPAEESRRLPVIR